jgi:hypothetical protein
MGTLQVGRDQRGITLPEILVGMVLAMVVTSLLVTGVIAVHRGTRFSGQDSESLASLRTARDRLVRDVRGARLVYATTTPRKLVVWLDLNRDFLQDSNEKVTWELQEVGTSANLVRYTEAAPTPRIHARNLIPGDVFTFPGTDDPANATLVDLSFTAKAEGQASGERTVETQVRFRNSDPAGVGSIGDTGGHDEDEDEED